MTEDAMRAEAARWFTRLQSTDLPLEQTLAEWQQWMGADPRHAAAFQSLEETWQRFATLPRPAPLPREAIESDEYDASIPVSEWNRARTRARVLDRSFLFGLAASVVLSIGCLTAVVIVRTSGTQVIETRIGENRDITLVDGSRVAMGGNSRIEVRMVPQRRNVKLVRGEALFKVAKDASRPFSVLAGSAAVTAVGTQFNVRRSSDRVVVSVLEGQVRVQPLRTLVSLPWMEGMVPSVNQGSAAEVDMQHRVLVDEHGMGATATLPDVAAATAWQNGHLSFDNEPLRYVVEVVNRYSPQRIVIADPALEDLRVSGTVLSDHVTGWVASLDTALGVQATTDGGNIILRRR
jgi:transmembrane sensor